MGAKILIVEDEAIVAKDLGQLLESLGHTVVGSESSAEKAVSAARSETPDLILMDIRLGGKSDGIDAARRILQQRSVPIIYTTAYADEPTFSRARATNPFGYLIKPIDERDLRTAIELALYKHRMETELIRRVKLESFLSDVNALLLASDQESARHAISKILASAARFAGVDRSFLVLLDRNEPIASAAFEWHAPHLNPVGSEYRGLHMESLPWLMGRCSESEPVCIRSVGDLPPEAVNEKDLWLRQGIESLIGAPLMINGIPAGWLAFATETGPRLWGGDDIRLTSLLAQNFAGFIARLKAEGKVLEAEEKFKSLVETLREVIFSLDANGYFTFIGGNIEQLAGYVQDEIVGQHFTRFVHPHDRDALTADWDRTIGGRLGSFDFRIVTKGGDLRWIRTSSRPVYEAEDLSGLTGIMMDVTAEKTTRASLNASEDRYRKLWELSSDGLVLVDGETGEILDCNREFCAQSGRSKEQLLRLHIWEIRPVEMRDAARKKFLEIREKGGGGSAELSFERPDGSRVEVDFLSSVVHLDDKRVIQSRCRRIRQQ